MLYSNDKEYDINDVIYFFGGFRRLLKSILFIISYILRMIIPAIICYLPAIAFFCANNYLLKQKLNDTAFNVILYSLIIVYSLILLIYSTKYFLSIKLYCEDQSKNINYYFSTSKKMMKGHKNNVIRLALSFTPWILLCITVLPLLYVVPYFTQALCISGKWIYELSRNGQDNELL